MARDVSVLVTAAGTIVAQGIIKSLKLANQNPEGSARYRIVTADLSPQAAGFYRGDLGILVPAASSPDYVGAISRICKEEDVRAVFVGADEELLVLAAAASGIARETGATTVTDTPEQISVCQDKWKTFELLKRHGLPCAESALPEDEERFVREFGLPLVVKPREGHGSLHFYVARDRDELHRAISTIQEAGWRPFFQEYLPGVDQEFTSGVTVARDGKTVLSSISMRRLLKGGQTFKAFVDDYGEVRRAAEEAAIKIGSHGPVNVQARLVGDEPKIFEINPRFSASCPIRAVAGVNEPDIIFRNWVLGEKVKTGGYRRLVCLRYFNEVYVPISVYEDAEKTGRTQRTEEDGAFIPDYF